MKVLVSLILWPINLIWLIGCMSLLMILQWFIPADKLEPLTRLYCRIQLMLTGSRITYHIDPRIDNTKNYFFCQNHVNLLDHVTVYNATPHFKQGIELASHFGIPFYGWFMKQRGTIGVRSGNGGNRALLKSIESELKQNHSLLFFPEGGRTLNGQLKPFTPGLFKVADTLNIEIVPVVVCGMYKVLQKGDWHIMPFQKVDVYLLEPRDLKLMPQVNLAEKVNAIEELMAAKLNQQPKIKTEAEN
jgi:1-acyl-sn-glycerol-3-phosphate acyltransferase